MLPNAQVDKDYPRAVNSTESADAMNVLLKGFQGMRSSLTTQMGVPKRSSIYLLKNYNILETTNSNSSLKYPQLTPAKKWVHQLSS
jgi:hypothetical protein